MPYKLLMTHRVKPGHYEEVKKWFSEADKRRRSDNPAYERPKRYVTVFGETTEVITEVQMNEVKAGGSWLQGNAGHMEHMDSVKFTVLKEIDDYDE